ncbi:NUDIX domain-containing protein [Arthrobacter sp. 1P04PC]|uniref:NUDIX domain-containing protein n=1 Tax=unclassified Arthrobacter TaxID=235627 RepID=UPI00399F9EB0
MDDRFQLTPVSYVVFRRRDCVLLQLRKGTGYLDGHWADAAAGHVESNESAIGAAAREAYEELGIVVSSADLRPLVVTSRGVV